MGETCRFCEGPMTATNVRVIAEDLYEHCDRGDCIITLQGRTENLRSEVARLRAVVDAADAMAENIAQIGGIADMPWSREYVSLHAYRTARAALADPSSFAAMSTEEKMRVIDAKLAARGETHAEFLDRLGAALDAKEG